MQESYKPFKEPEDLKFYNAYTKKCWWPWKPRTIP